jgi:hypothetical protein
MDEIPVVIMVADPNGAGKSSIAPGLLAKALGVVEYVNADVIARGISGFNPEGAALRAGRVMLARLDNWRRNANHSHLKPPEQAEVSLPELRHSETQAIIFCWLMSGSNRQVFPWHVCRNE